MTTFAASFLGCKVSQADMMLARQALLDAGHVETDADGAELALVTTCCITREAEAQIAREIMKFAANGTLYRGPGARPTSTRRSSPSSIRG